MNSKALPAVFLFILAIVFFCAYSTLFTVRQTQYALVLRLGKALAPIEEPGLHFKAPFIDSVIYFDKWVLDVDLPVQNLLSSDRQNLEVDAFLRYRITDPLKFFQVAKTKEGANDRLTSFVNASLRNVLASATRDAIVRTDRAKLMEAIQHEVEPIAKSMGVELVDLRLTRVDLPNVNSQAVFERMRKEREQEAADIRARGQQEAVTLRAKAEREATITVAEANKTAEQLRGQGDAEKNRILAEAYSSDEDFFRFYRSMQAYGTGLAKSSTNWVLSPNSEFFRYLSTPKRTDGQ